MNEPTATDRHFERAMLEALHADLLEHTRDEPDESVGAREDPIERRIRVWDHEARKWRLVVDAMKGWS